MKELIVWLKGFFSREFLLAVAAVLGAIAEAGVLPEDSGVLKAVMIGLAVLASLGYGYQRTKQKLADK